MRLLLDTHTFMWASLEPGKIGPNASVAIKDRANELFVSAASTWEMAIKINIGKMTVPSGLSTFLVDAMHEWSLVPLHIRPEHTLILETLPRHHGDPFDRMLVAQSMYEHMPIVSIDAKLDAYGVSRIW
jgi:PIN domain nuclease of toxin-antitoxin system